MRSAAPSFFRWPGLLLFVAVASSLFVVSHGLVRGDLIKTSTRARYSSVETPWTGVTSKYSPRFRYDKAVHLPNPQQIKDHDFFKMSFSFVDDKFITPWITVWDAKENIYLNYVEFVFTWSGNDIIDVDYHLDYNNDPEHAGKVLSTILMRFTWNERSVEDVDTMLAFMLCGGFMLSVSMVLYITMTAQTKLHLHNLSGIASEEARPMSSSLPYFDTSSYEYASPVRGETFTTAGDSRPSHPDEPVGEVVTERRPPYEISTLASSQDEPIAMEELTADDQEATVVDDFVSLETSALPSAAPALTYLQQPIVRRKGREEQSKND